jgi:7-cyano-7-deazaguanine synthase
MPATNRGVLLLSGGMDSVTLLAKLLHEGWNIYPVIFDYGQRHRTAENEAAKLVWAHYLHLFPGQLAPYKLIKIDLTQIGNSALTDSTINVPNNMAEQARTVVPFRNTLMTTLGAAYAETLGINDVFITPVKEDYEAYPDCRTSFFKALSTALTLGATHQPFDINILTPYVNIWKKDIIAQGLGLDVPYELTHSCYKGLRPACGECPACRERAAAFKANGVEDPIEYQAVAV